MRGWGRDRERDPLPLDNGDFHNSNAPEAPSWCGEADLSSRDQRQYKCLASELGPDAVQLATVISKPDGQMSRLSIGAPPPLDLTPYLVKISDRYSAGGGFGDVYRSWYYAGLVPKQVQVAVKAFRFRFTLAEDADIESHKMLRRELGIWRRLSHTNIVPFLGVVHRLQFLLDIANGLQYFVHGDLSCNNVLLDGDYTARLGDFGYASLVGNIPEVLTYLRRSTTRPGALRWIAPEQIDFENTFVRTTKSDIYSFGCLGLQVLSGKQPWSEVREDAAVVLRIARGYKPGRPASRPVDDLHWELIERCWLSIEERPAVETIPLRDIMIMSDNSSIAEPSFGQAPTDASYTHVGTLDRENENRIASLPGLSGSVRFRQRDDSSDTSSGQVVAESHGESPYKRRRV
ncbi:kinase-like domain-containing protein [Boletus coccyginus]|nr:kinase-like domain-containing protein [Boletus coccyginus]